MIDATQFPRKIKSTPVRKSTKRPFVSLEGNKDTEKFEENKGPWAERRSNALANSVNDNTQKTSTNKTGNFFTTYEDYNRLRS